MNVLLFLILPMCFFVLSAELVGPDTTTEPEKKSKNLEEDEDNSLEIVEPKHRSLDELSELVKKEYAKIQEYAEAMKKKNLAENKDVQLDDIYDWPYFREQRRLRMIFENNFQGEQKFDQISDKTQSSEDSSPQNQIDALEILPSLDEEEEAELTPELKEGKEIYDAAMAKIKRRTPELSAAILQIKIAADKGYVPAKIKIAWSQIYGEGVDMDWDAAKNTFEELAEEGNAEAQAGLGFMYATGIGVPVSQAKALVFYTMGASGNSAFAQMALAYRHWAGLTVPSSCPKALELYIRVAAKVASEVSINGGAAIQRVRLMDEADSSSGLDSDLIEYYRLLAEKGDVQAQVGLGQLHFQGGRGVTLDVAKARHYFQQAANTGNAVANAFLGKIYLEGGDGIVADNETAIRYFRKAAEFNNPVGQSGMGLMFLQGRGVPKDAAAAIKYFTLAANQGWVEGQLHLGLMYFGGIGVRRDFKQANKYFSLASQSGHVLALYHLAHMHARGLGVPPSCTSAVELFKNVCERGPWSSRLMLAHAAWRGKRPLAAFASYAALGERGLEVAQSNAAFLLDAGELRWAAEEAWRRALQLWARAAAQGSGGARVKLGDYHYYGLGTRQDFEAAAQHYRVASEQLHSAQATFNLGYMHERGLGLARDPHLAKRCYDLAADAAQEARLPAALALARLNAYAALDSLCKSPLAVLFLTGDSIFFSNWDLYLITALLGALGLVVYLRRPQ